MGATIREKELEDFVSGWNLSQKCDFVFSGNKTIEKDGQLYPETVIQTNTHDVKKGEVVFCKTDHLPILRKKFHRNGTPYHLVTHDSDFEINKALFNTINDYTNLLSWRGININHEHEKLSSVPIGLANDYCPISLKKKDIGSFVKEAPSKLLYINCNPKTNPEEREPIYSKFESNGKTTLRKPGEIGSKQQYMEEITEHKFALCPRGSGIDTHRLWECMYLGVIPIVKDCINVRFFSDLPILVIDNFLDLVGKEDYLEEVYEEYSRRVWNFEKLTTKYWIPSAIDRPPVMKPADTIPGDKSPTLNSPRRRILLIEPRLHPPGGSEAVSVWMIEALKDEYDLTMLTWTPVDFASINRYYGTSLGPSDFKVFVVPAVIQHMINLIPDIWGIQRSAVLMRWCKFIRHRYDFLLSARIEIDFGSRGIQYVHYPYQEVNWRREPHHQSGMGCLISFIKTRIRPWRIISGFSFDRMRRNKTLTNSEWTRRRFYEVYGTDATTVYPPVPGDFPDIPWEEKEIGFVCIGRLSSEKRYEVIIDILTAVRSHVPDVHLHIIGSAVKYDQDYYERVRRKAEANNDWVFLHEDISRKELTDLICRHRYGIHGMVDEHFGIAVAEMVRGGCIVFVPDSGGQVEIVGNEDRLLYHTAEEAVNKILRVMNQPQEQAELRYYLGLRRDLFTTERFVQRIREEVRDFLAEKPEQLQ